MLKKKSSGGLKSARTASAVAVETNGTVDRRGFLRSSGLAVGGLTAIAGLTAGRVQKAQAQAAAGAA